LAGESEKTVALKVIPLPQNAPPVREPDLRAMLSWRGRIVLMVVFGAVALFAFVASLITAHINNAQPRPILPGSRNSSGVLSQPSSGASSGDGFGSGASAGSPGTGTLVPSSTTSESATTSPAATATATRTPVPSNTLPAGPLGASSNASTVPTSPDPATDTITPPSDPAPTDSSTPPTDPGTSGSSTPPTDPGTGDTGTGSPAAGDTGTPSAGDPGTGDPGTGDPGSTAPPQVRQA
jgi:hypothetical protein